MGIYKLKFGVASFGDVGATHHTTLFLSGWELAMARTHNQYYGRGQNHGPGQNYGPGQNHGPGHEPTPPAGPPDSGGSAEQGSDIYAGLGSLAARESDGSDNVEGGQVGDTYVRITPNSYADADNAADLIKDEMPLSVLPLNPAPPWQNQPSGDLPQPEAISAAVMDLLPGDQVHPSTSGANELFDFFGQVLTHDVAEASTQTSDPVVFIDGLPFPFARTLGEVDPDTGVREQINEETSFLDLGFVYGNRDDRLELARADISPGSGVQSAKLLLGDDGLLPTIGEVAADSGITAREVLTIFTEPGFAGLPNPATAADGSFEGLYYAGDNRANQQSALLTLQTVWAREHNYQVDKLEPYATAQGWTQDELFNAARAITEAEWQHVVYDEYVPTLIGNQADDLLDAYKDFVGISAYNAITPGIINEWTTVAFRFGHDQSSNDYTLIDAAGLTTVVSLAQAFGQINADTPEGIDSWIRGLTAQSAQEIDGKVADGNREFLFGGGAIDLEAFDIQRGRDHGVWNYNELRAGLGLSTYDNFADFGDANGIDGTLLQALSDVYGGDITKLDSIVGGLLEEHYAGSQLGATFTLLTAIQFDLLKTGDQFYYEDRLAGNPELLADIKGMTFAEILERNSGTQDDSGTVSHLHLDSFQVANVMEGGAGGDVMHGADIMYDADSNAFLNADLMIGGNGNDRLYGGLGNDTLYGDKGNDTLDGGVGDDWLRGGDGNDKLDGGWGDDNVRGEDGNDRIDLGYGDDWADGGKGNDTIDCGAGDDCALGKEGNDTISGGWGNDQLFGGDGKDTVSGDAGDDYVYGGADKDKVSGGDGNDHVYGDDGDDKVSGDDGNDYVYGGGGNDQLYGGRGCDTFVFCANSGQDSICDFNVKQDTIDLSALEQFTCMDDLTITTRRGTTTIDLGDADMDGHSDTIQLVGVSHKMLNDLNIIFHDDATVA